MVIIMLQTMNETINNGATRQDFIQGACYPVPDAIGQLWIGRGWARAAAAQSENSVTNETRATGRTSESGASRQTRRSPHPSRLTPHGGN